MNKFQIIANFSISLIIFFVGMAMAIFLDELDTKKVTFTFLLMLALICAQIRLLM